MLSLSLLSDIRCTGLEATLYLCFTRFSFIVSIVNCSALAIVATPGILGTLVFHKGLLLLLICSNVDEGVY